MAKTIVTGITTPRDVRTFAHLCNRFENLPDGNQRDPADDKLLTAYALIGMKEQFNLEEEGILEAARDYIMDQIR